MPGPAADPPLSTGPPRPPFGRACLGAEALDLEALGEKRRRTLGGNVMPTGLGDFFFHVEDPLRPEDGLEDEEFDVDDLD